MLTKQIADLCDENQGKRIEVLPAKFKNYGGLKRFYGQVITLKIDKSNFHLIDLLKNEKGDGKIIVIDNAQEFFGVVGDKLMGYAKENNWRAMIINGYVRDTNETKNIDVGLYAIGTCPLRNFENTQSKRGIILNFEGVTIANGDYIYADEDGVIITKEKLI